MSVVGIEDIAKACHEVNRGYCASLGDFSQVNWEHSQKWQRDSAINGVKFHIANPTATAEDSHNSWLKEKVADGWEHGPIKDAVRKRHPCFVPYHQLPQAQRSKDFLFRSTVHALAGLLPKEGTQKIVRTDNYARENRDNHLVCENITNESAAFVMLNALQNSTQRLDDHWYALQPQDQLVYKFEP